MLGKGAQFEITAPGQHVRAGDITKRQRVDDAIDDNADNADAAFVLSMVVSAYDRQAGVANSGCACLQMALDFHSEIVFLDVGMPDLSGDDVAIALRRLPTLEHIYDAAVTGWNDAALGTGPSATVVRTAPHAGSTTPWLRILTSTA